MSRSYEVDYPPVTQCDAQHFGTANGCVRKTTIDNFDVNPKYRKGSKNPDESHYLSTCRDCIDELKILHDEALSTLCNAKRCDIPNIANDI